MVRRCVPAVRPLPRACRAAPRAGSVLHLPPPRPSAAVLPNVSLRVCGDGARARARRSARTDPPVFSPHAHELIGPSTPDPPAPRPRSPRASSRVSFRRWPEPVVDARAEPIGIIFFDARVPFRRRRDSGRAVHALRRDAGVLHAGRVRAAGGGQREHPNTKNTLFKNLLDMCCGALTFYLVGYGLLYGEGNGSWWHRSPSSATTS